MENKHVIDLSLGDMWDIPLFQVNNPYLTIS